MIVQVRRWYKRVPVASIPTHSIANQRGSQLATIPCQVCVTYTILLPLVYIFCRLYPAALSYEGPEQDEHLDNVHRFERPYNSKNEILLSYISASLLTCSYRLYWGAARSRAATLHQLTSNVSEKKNLAGGKPGASDFALYSALVNLNLQGDLSAEVYF